MTPSTVTSPATLGFYCTEREAVLALTRILNGDSLPGNVLDYIDPYQYKPENLPGEVWFYVKCNGNSNSSFGHWRQTGGDCKLCSNSFSTGWRTTYEYYEGQAPHEHKTPWVMQKYWMSQSGACENSKQKETSSLCKVFIKDEPVQNHEKIQKVDFSTIPNSEPIYPNHQLVVPDGSNNMANGSTSKSEMSEDDKMVDMAVAGKPLDHHLEVILSEMDYISKDDCLKLLGYLPLDNHLEEIASEMDCISRGEFLQILDLSNPASPSSSSENSSCLSMSSDEYFDSMALLRDIEHDNNFDTVRRDSACISSAAPSRLRREVVDQGGSESLVDTKRSQSLGEEILKPEPGVPSSGCIEPGLKLPNKRVSKGKEPAAVDGGTIKKKKSIGRKMKKIQKKYFCFLSF